MTRDAFNPDKCNGVTVLPPASFYPVGWFDSNVLYDKREEAGWEGLFEDSYTVHFYQSSRKRETRVMKRRHYGQAVPGMLYLATRHCPLAFNSERLF